eukprot:Skav231730  [mRNA]  locus=scaffold2515:329814:332360:+ [translate_table: standard]
MKAVTAQWLCIIVEIDSKRLGKEAAHDMLREEPYSSICHAAMAESGPGRPQLQNLEHLAMVPQTGSPYPSSGEVRESIWGLPSFQQSDQDDADDDSILLLRQMVIQALAFDAAKRAKGPPPGLLLEHPEHPAVCSTSPHGKRCSSIWTAYFLRVTDPTLRSPGIWPTKEEFAGEELDLPDFPELQGRDNYPSAKDFIQEILKTFEDEKALGHILPRRLLTSTNVLFALAQWPPLMRGTRYVPSTIAPGNPTRTSRTTPWNGALLRQSWIAFNASNGFKPGATVGLRLPLAVRPHKGRCRQSPQTSQGPPQGLAVSSCILRKSQAAGLWNPTKLEEDQAGLDQSLAWLSNQSARSNCYHGTMETRNIMALLQQAAGAAFAAKEIEKALGRISWATTICPMTRSFLQPLWAWKVACKIKGCPAKIIRRLASLLLTIFSKPVVDPSPYKAHSTWRGASDASASKHGEAYVGGWLTDCPSPSKDQVLWFQLRMNPSTLAWALKDGGPSRHIPPLEMFGALLLTALLISKRTPGTVNLPLELVTDNQGNAYSLLSRKAKQFPCSAFLMQIVLLLYDSWAHLCPSHRKRDFNQWADDDLTHPQPVGFAHHLQLDLMDSLRSFTLLPVILSEWPQSFKTHPCS